jgi:group I intron endonuclease
MNIEEYREVPSIPGIYKITSPTGKVYIGQSQNIKNRYKDYLYVHPSFKTTKIGRSILKYGIDSHNFGILEETQDLDSREVYYMEKHRSVEEGLNTIKRNYTYYFTSEDKKKVSEGLKKSWTEERKHKHSGSIKKKWEEGSYEDRKGLGENLKDTMSVRDIRDGKVKRVSREEYLENDHYTGTNKGRSNTRKKKPLQVVETGETFSGVVECYKTLGITTKKFYDWISEGKIVYL